MAEERITERTDANGNVVETTIERNVGAAPVTVNAAPSSGGSSLGFFAVLLLIAVAVGGYFLYSGSQSENRKDDAMTEAANDVGDAAKQVGNSVEKAVDKIDGK